MKGMGLPFYKVNFRTNYKDEENKLGTTRSCIINKTDPH